jgi:hypothetical protein
MKDRIDESKLKQNISALYTDLSKDLPAFTGRTTTTTKHQIKKGDGEGGQGPAKRQCRENQTLNESTVSCALTKKGYHIQLEEEIEGWTPRHPVRRLSVNEILIDIEELIRRFPTAEAHPESGRVSRTWPRYAQAARQGL